MYRKSILVTSCIDQVSDYIKIRRGVRHGCAFFPFLLKLSEIVFRKPLEGVDIGIEDTGVWINKADDTMLIADNMHVLQRLVNKVE